MPKKFMKDIIIGKKKIVYLIFTRYKENKLLVEIKFTNFKIKNQVIWRFFLDGNLKSDCGPSSGILGKASLRDVSEKNFPNPPFPRIFYLSAHI